MAAYSDELLSLYSNSVVTNGVVDCSSPLIVNLQLFLKISVDH